MKLDLFLTKFSPFGLNLGDLGSILVQFSPKWAKLDIFLTYEHHEIAFIFLIFEQISSILSSFWAIYAQNELFLVKFSGF